MRITNNMLINNIMLSLSNNLNRTQKYQSQLATGKKITMPSDDPIVASKALKLRTDVAEIQQYRRNADDAISWMEITEATMNQIGEVVHRFRRFQSRPQTAQIQKMIYRKSVQRLKSSGRSSYILPTPPMRDAIYSPGTRLINPCWTMMETSTSILPTQSRSDLRSELAMILM